MPQKPVECMRRPILNNSSPGQAVYEPFMGSGTTLIAAETTGRVCLGIELNPAYVDVAVERWQRFTGKAAVLDGSGESFGDLVIGRRGSTGAALGYFSTRILASSIERPPPRRNPHPWPRRRDQGMSTVSMPWITPFDCMTSGIVIFATSPLASARRDRQGTVRSCRRRRDQ